MVTPAEIFDRHYRYGNVPENERSALREQFVQEVGQLDALPRTAMVEFAPAANYEAAFISFHYDLKGRDWRTYQPSVIMIVLAVDRTGALSGYLYRRLIPYIGSVDMSPLTPVLELFRKAQRELLRMVTPRGIDQWKTTCVMKAKSKAGRKQSDSFGRSVKRKGGVENLTSFSMNPFSKSFFLPEVTCGTFTGITRRYYQLTRRGQKRSFEENQSTGLFGKKKSHEGVKIWKEFSVFRDRFMQREIVCAFHRHNLAYTLRAYNWFNALGEPQRQKYRLQAVNAFPALAEAIMKSEVLTDAVDRGEKLIEAICLQMGLSPDEEPIIRSLSGKSTQLTRMRSYRSERHLIFSLRLLPAHQWPRTSKGWETLLRTDTNEMQSVGRYGFDNLAGYAKKRGIALDRIVTDVSDFFREAGLVFIPWESMEDIHGYDREDGWRQKRDEEVRKFVLERYRSNYTWSEDWAPDIEHDILVAEAISRISYKRWMEISDRFHTKRRDINRMFAPSNAALPRAQWPALCDPQCIDGVTIRFLTTAKELLCEHEEMGHCVDGYVSECLFRGSHIAACIGEDGGRATVELHFNATEGKAVLRQIESYRRELPGERIQRAVRKLINGINSGRISVNPSLHDIEVVRDKWREAQRTAREEQKRLSRERNEAMEALVASLLPRSVQGSLRRIKELRERVMNDQSVREEGRLVG